MLKKLLATLTMTLAMFFTQVSFTADAKDERQADKGCKDGKLCYLAVSPHVCTPPGCWRALQA